MQKLDSLLISNYDNLHLNYKANEQFWNDKKV